jgi:bifunctional UDP-N-acetylglucosamine pyrophosphorylase/glucosamine-1-phosphate N-acetyltransferase
LKAVILAAGKGERLKPFTETRPKHLLAVGGTPLLEWSIKALVEAGIYEVLIVTHYMENILQAYFGDGSNLGVSISYIRQNEMKGTADAFKMAKEFVGDDEFLGFYGDLFVKPDMFRNILETHRAGDIDMAVVEVKEPSLYGIVGLEGNFVNNIVEKPEIGDEPSNLANAGIYIFSPGIFNHIDKTFISTRNEYEITDSLRVMIDSGTNVRAVKIPEKDWLDIGLPWHLLEANERALCLKAASIKGEIEEGATILGSVIICEGARVRAGAYIEGPAYIGPKSDIGPNCYIRPFTSLGRDVRIGNACEVKNSIIMDGTHAAHQSYIGDSIIGEKCNLGAGTITANIRFDKRNVKVRVREKKLDSGRRKMGVIMGDKAQTGINVSLLPGVKVGSGAWIAPGLTVYGDVASGEFLKASKPKIRLLKT